MQQHRVAMNVAVIAAVLVAAYASSRVSLHGSAALRSSTPLQTTPAAPASRSTFQSADLYRLKSGGDVQMRPAWNLVVAA